MNKQEYFNKSRAQDLPNRCPILQYCSRRALTIYFLNRYHEDDPINNYALKLRKEGELPDDFEEKYIKMQGEPPGGSFGQEHGWFHDVCPEVNLFDTMNALGYFKGSACSSGTYDKEGKPEYNIVEERHFSECLEFSTHLFEHKFSTTPSNRPKKSIKQEPCYTYLMFDKTLGLYKIGISKTPEFRERTLQGQQPQIELLEKRKFTTRIYAKNLEKELHLKFKKSRTRGEWFKLSKLDIREIVEILKE